MAIPIAALAAMLAGSGAAAPAAAGGTTATGAAAAGATPAATGTAIGAGVAPAATAPAAAAATNPLMSFVNSGGGGGLRPPSGAATQAKLTSLGAPPAAPASAPVQIGKPTPVPTFGDLGNLIAGGPGAVGSSPIPAPRPTSVDPRDKSNLQTGLGSLADAAASVQNPAAGRSPMPPAGVTALGGSLDPSIAALLTRLLGAQPAPSRPTLGSLIGG